MVPGFESEVLALLTNEILGENESDTVDKFKILNSI